MNINNRQQLLAILAIAAVAIWAGDKLVVSPLTRTWTARVKQIAELRKSVSQGNGLLGREQSIRNRWDSMRTNTLPNEVSVAENQVLKSFERWSQESTSASPQSNRSGNIMPTITSHSSAGSMPLAISRL